MASSYTLPASAIHNHHAHSHSHSHSHSASPSRPFSNSSRTLKSEKSNSSLYDHSASESSISHGHEQDFRHLNSAAPDRSHDRVPRFPTSPSSNGFIPDSSYEQPKSGHYHRLSQVSSHEPSLNNVKVIPYSHDHCDHHDQAHAHHTRDHDHDHGHTHDYHDHKHAKALEPHSRFTGLILPVVQWSPLLHTIMAEKDSRRIFYFMSLNFAFMLVQAFYGYATDSLGLLSDSIHMLFDCLALAVGLFASVASKWPPSERFPYGFGKIESLSGFGNGVFLMLISVEIIIEATERLADGRETKRLLELFVVSGMGLAVNLVGMACFGHHHHGHDHGEHSHGHSHSSWDGKAHSHDDGHSHEPCEKHNRSRESGHDHDGQTPVISEASNGGHTHHHHGHSHDNDNMHGIFLHVLADTMGSAAVMVSTALIYFTKWSGWDPIASCVIAILIFLSSIPLIKSTAKKLLLTVPDDVEYSLRATLSAVSDLRGVASYSVPRFWLGDKNVELESEGVLGVIHILTTRGSELDDVRERTRALLQTHGIDATIQVEKEGDMSCWCSIASGRPPNPSNGSRF